ncbi:hypothetical protein RHMOL_Rhmol12G0121400 [Rhododendron molle]|uniref:Uncharacterized protein n=1 Tax=Rhododendron molle TaxID=49168 RepID=A0ACC0LH60_RHOML|nr:hypothetical protein RHMOL_Rhmol12G0121400 [Rhododendron molle]
MLCVPGMQWFLGLSVFGFQVMFLVGLSLNGLQFSGRLSTKDRLHSWGLPVDGMCGALIKGELAPSRALHHYADNRSADVTNVIMATDAFPPKPRLDDANQLDAQLDPGMAREFLGNARGIMLGLLQDVSALPRCGVVS